jgi:probable HAF family extracellular repeat protein
MNATQRAFVVAPSLFLMCLAVPVAHAQSFSGLGFLPGGTQSAAARVNRDGMVVVGASANHAFRWTNAGGMVDLGTLPGGTNSYASDVSDDGSVVVGTSSSAPGPRAFRWTSAGMVDLGLPLDGGGDGEAVDSYGEAVSGDGAVITGFSSPINDAFRWTSAGGMVSLGTLTGVGYSIGYDCNSDGSVLVGVSTGSNDDHAIRYTVAGGLQDLGTMPGGTTSQGMSVSGDGATVVGFGGTSGFAQIRGFRWTSAGGMVSLGTLPGMASRAYGVSGNGQVVVGTLMSPDHAMLWTSSLGMVDLNTYLPSLGINLTGWILTTANGVSGDGRTLVGTGTHNGLTEAWVAHLPSPTAAGGVPDGGEVPGMPLMVGMSSTPGDLELSWGPSCQPGDSDYAVYEGLLGDFASHAPRLCGTGGATSVTLTPASGNRYYLVVPLSPDGAEGSYGTASDGSQRPPSATSCQPQVFTGCM